MFERPQVSPVPSPNVLRLLANNPELLKRFAVFASSFASNSSLSLRERELLVLRTAWRAGCEYEFAQHRARAESAGITPAELRRLCSEEAGWPPQEEALLATVDELHASGAVSDATWDRLRTAYDDAQLIELLLLPGFYNMLGGLLNTTRLALDDGLSGWLDGTRG